MQKGIRKFQKGVRTFQKEMRAFQREARRETKGFELREPSLDISLHLPKEPSIKLNFPELSGFFEEKKRKRGLRIL